MTSISMSPPPPSNELTPRERATLALVVAGDSNPEIAEALGITAGTAKFHVENIVRKLGAKNRLTAAVAAVRQGLV